VAAGLSDGARAALRGLARQSWCARGDAYLAGSAALAVHCGHREVRDLDLMTATNRLTGPERRDLLAELKGADPSARIETARDGFLFARLDGGVGLKVFYYPYPLVEASGETEGLTLASLVDLGLMKLAAIISRGARRDFVDLFLLCRRVTLDDLLRRAPEKFGHVGDFTLQALKALADHSELGDEPMPRLAAPLSWSEVDAWLRSETERLASGHLLLGPG
jgi:hypothetical protein